jgi:hypothetical protein
MTEHKLFNNWVSVFHRIFVTLICIEDWFILVCCRITPTVKPMSLVYGDAGLRYLVRVRGGGGGGCFKIYF